MKSTSLLRWLCSSTCVLGALASAMTPIEVQRALDKGSNITFIDVRPIAKFKEAHIPNAISVPASLVPLKEFPPLGTVVVYDDGLGADTATPAVVALNKKAGITAQVLEGGFAAWETARAATTHVAGLSPDTDPFITYDVLKKTSASDVVLVDLRTGSTGVSSVKATAGTQSDLASAFPGMLVTKSPFQVPAAKSARASSSTTPPLLVLIDSGDGSAQAMARNLKANGVKRFVILAGGDDIIQRQGQSGLDRIGSTISVRKPGTAATTDTTK